MMARDYLTVLAASVSVERLFNKVRDIYSYRRHNLKAGTIRLLIMLMCIDQFNIREEYQGLSPAIDLEEGDIKDKGVESNSEHSLTSLISDNKEEEIRNISEIDFRGLPIEPFRLLSPSPHVISFGSFDRPIGL